MEKILKKKKNLFKRLFVLAVFCIVIVEVTSIKKLIINILIFSESKGFLFGLKIYDLKRIYNLLREISLVYIFFCVVCFLIYKLALFFLERYFIPESTSLTSFEESLHAYLNRKSDGKSYLVSGEWGSGKTYQVSRFFEKFYRFSSRPIYRVSCFGLDSRSMIIEEIKNQIELNDNSILNWFQFIPIIGKPIFGLLKESYSLQNVPQSAIFIFDDFERITPLGINNGSKNYLYKKNVNLLSSDPFTGKKTIKEFTDINSEFQRVEDSFSRLAKEKSNQSIVSNLQKYNAVTGLINELSENYRMKVIIICNIDILGYDYVDKIFRGKLDCITYNKSVDKWTLKSIFEESIENQVYSNEEQKILINQFAENIVNDFEEVWLSTGDSNLRQVKSVIQGFLDTVILIEQNDSVNEEYLISLFYSMYIVAILRDENSLKNLNSFLIGGNLNFYLILYGKVRASELLSLSKYSSKLKWTGISIAGFWLLNLQRPNNIRELIKYFKDYSYNNLETKLINYEDAKFEKEYILIEHILYVVKLESRDIYGERSATLVEMSSQIQKSVELIFSDNINQNIIIVKKLLTKLDESSGGMYNSTALNKWYEAIFKYSKVENIEENQKESITTIRDYNKYTKSCSSPKEQF